MPLPDASVDLVVSSFVLQLVPDRAAALREAAAYPAAGRPACGAHVAGRR